MEMSATRRTALYNAVAEEIMQYRITMKQGATFTRESVDADMFYLSNRIWNNIEKTLKLDQPAAKPRSRPKRRQ